jgi:hypothetical protein
VRGARRACTVAIVSENEPEFVRGQQLYGAGGQRVGSVDAVFADYLLVRSAGLLPVDLYVPRPEVEADATGRPSVKLTRSEAYDAWHRPLKRVAHDGA